MLRSELEDDLLSLSQEEAKINEDLNAYFTTLSGKISSQSKSNNNSSVFEASDITSNLRKVEDFSPYYEVMEQDSKKLTSQVEACRSLSDKINVMVRRLDTMQIRSQQALACTEDIINLKESKIRLQKAIEDKNLVSAVHCIKRVHMIDKEAANASDDYKDILSLESTVKDLVQADFNEAINKSELKDVMGLCPLLQTLGLENSAREQFLEFVNNNVFTAVTADEASVGGATDPATGYAQSLTSIFNNAYLILQKYLPLVITGLENSYGDIHFIKRLHHKCEKEAGLVLKRYMKFRSVKDIIVQIKNAGIDGCLRLPTKNLSSTQSSSSSDMTSIEHQSADASSTEVHVLLDELALLIQYCCLYCKYIHQLCNGARNRVRIAVASIEDDLTTNTSTDSALEREQAQQEKHATAIAEVFLGPVAFEDVIDELINNYYMVAERWVMQRSVKHLSDISTDSGDKYFQIDECFFVLQRCGQRAVATNNIKAACFVLHLIGDLLSSELLSSMNDMIIASTKKLAMILYTKTSEFVNVDKKSSKDQRGKKNSILGRNIRSKYSDDDDLDLGLNTDLLDKTLQSAISLASTTLGGRPSGASDSQHSSEYTEKILNSSASNTLGGQYNEQDQDAYGTMEIMETFNIVDRCSQYTTRLGAGVISAAESIFMQSIDATEEADKIRLCKEEFNAAAQTFSKALAGELEKVVRVASKMMKSIFEGILSTRGPQGGISFDKSDDDFEMQPALNSLPHSLTGPLEIVVSICTQHLSDANKDTVLKMLIDACCDRIEQFVGQQSFRFSGALKFEECVRAVTSMFGKFSSSSVRTKFSRIREVMMVLTSDGSSSVEAASMTFSDSLSQLTTTEAQAILSLREDLNM